MTVFETENKEIIKIYKDYKKLKNIIQYLKNLKKHLIDNDIIKESNNYIVFKNDKFSYTYANKFNKLLLSDYVENQLVEDYIEIHKIYNQYFISFEGELIQRTKEKYIGYPKEDITQFKFNNFYELKKKLKKIIINKINNINVRTI
jgi:hypothetical protein